MLNPKEFKLETTSVWSFPERGTWATHNPKYRGNFAPQVARNLIEKYTKVDDFIFDPMVGSGTSLIEAKLLNRNALGIDINPNAIELSNKSLDFDFHSTAVQKAKLGDARNLTELADNIIDLIIFHPPYLNIIEYSKGEIKEDLSNIGNIDVFCDEIEKVAVELYRVLKQNKYCAVLIGDTRKSQHYVPLSHFVLQRFLNVGFAIKEEIIKTQHNCTSSKRWEASANKWGFYLIMHEHLFVFRKPEKNENRNKIKWSLKNVNLK
ncbi:MAG: DNA methyltransferase [Bacteroidota bacterium]